MSILEDSRRTPTEVLQAFFVVPGAFESAMRRANIIPRPKNHGIPPTPVVYPQTPKPSPTTIPPTPTPQQSALRTDTSMEHTILSPDPTESESDPDTTSLPPINKASEEVPNEGTNQTNDPTNISTLFSAEENPNHAPNEATATSSQPIQPPPKAIREHSPSVSPAATPHNITEAAQSIQTETNARGNEGGGNAQPHSNMAEVSNPETTNQNNAPPNDTPIPPLEEQQYG
jgi:hypothetical protein